MFSTNNFTKLFIISVISLTSFHSLANVTEDQTSEKTKIDSKQQECLLQKLNEFEGHQLVSQIRKECDVEVNGNAIFKKDGALSQRIKSESRTKFDPYVITPHKMNYILPITHTDNINRKVYEESEPSWSENVDEKEAKYQISLKVPLNYGDLFFKNDALYFGITLQSWWQIYSDNISKPFRETNYQPEIFYLAGLDWKPFETNTGLAVGFEHQSNGRSTAISRSWNRVYLNFLMEKGNWVFSFKPYYRIKEDDKRYVGDPKGDDNPDINDYMGYFDAGLAYQYEDLEMTVLFHNNFATHKGGAEFGLTFPLWGKLRGYAQYYTGYGESLIDYNHKQNRLGVGFALTDIL